MPVVIFKIDIALRVWQNLKTYQMPLHCFAVFHEKRQCRIFYCLICKMCIYIRTIADTN